MSFPAASLRIVLVTATGLAVFGLVAAYWLTQTNVLARSRDITVVIPDRTGYLLSLGVPTAGITEQIDLIAGDRFILVNKDSENHRLGGLFVSAGSTVTAPFREAGSFNYACSVHGTGSTTFVVGEKARISRFLWSEAAVAGTTLLVIGAVAGRRNSRAKQVFLLTGISISAISGAVITGAASGLSTSNEQTEGPLASPAAVSIAAGHTNYLRFCRVCHGDTGAGDGPLASSIDLSPADLQEHVPQHSDAVLYRFIAEGIPGTSMPGLVDPLSTREIWDTVAYIKTLK